MSTESAAPVQSSPTAGNAKPAGAKKPRNRRPKASPTNSQPQSSPQNAASPSNQPSAPAATKQTAPQSPSKTPSTSQPQQNGHAASTPQSTNPQPSPSNNPSTSEPHKKKHHKPRGKAAAAKQAANGAPASNGTSHVDAVVSTSTSSPAAVTPSNSTSNAQSETVDVPTKPKNRQRRKKKLVAPASQPALSTQSPSPVSNSASHSHNQNSSSQRGQLRKPVFVKIADLLPATHGHNLHVKVIEVKVVFDKPRPDGSRFIINEALVADSTGSILLTMRNEQSNGVTAGSSITVRNAKIEMFKTQMRLAVDVWGLIEPSAQPLTEKLNLENNVSATEWELVDVNA